MVLGSSLAPITEVTRNTVGEGGIWLLGLVGAAHFLCYFYFSQESYDVKVEEAEEELDRSLQENRLVMLQKVREATITETNAILMGDVMPLARKEANTIRREFLQEFNALDEPVTKPKKKKKGAAAGAKKVKSPTPPPAEMNPNCSCGLPIGKGEGFCDYEMDGECMIDSKAAEAREAREQAVLEDDALLLDMEPLDLTRGSGK